MATNQTFESLDFDAIRRGDKEATGDAVEFLWQALNELDRRRRQGDTRNSNRAEWQVLPLSPTVALNDYDIGDAGVLRFDGSTAVNVTGLLAPSGGAARLVVLMVLGSATITLKHNNAGSELPNRILTQGAGDVAIATNRAVALHYLDSRWRELKWI